MTRTSPPWLKALIAGIALGLACVPLSLIGGAQPALAASTGTAEHWGTFFGDDEPGGSGTSLSPVGITLPGPVAEIGTSNSAQYALLTNGQVYAWARETTASWAMGTAGTPSPPPCACASPPE